MGALAVVEIFDVVKQFGACLLVGGEGDAVNQLQFECAPEAFHEGVVIAVGSAAHRRKRAGLGQSLAVSAGGVLDAAIGVEDEAGLGLFAQKGHAQGTQDERGVDRRAHVPAHDLARAEVHDCRDKEPALAGADIGDVANPQLVGGGRRWHFGQSVGRDGMIVVALGGGDAPAAFLPAAEAFLPHEAGNAITTMESSFLAQFHEDAGAAVGLAAASMNVFDARAQTPGSPADERPGCFGA